MQITICTTKVTKKAVINISFPIKGNWNIFQSLRRGCAAINTNTSDEKTKPLDGKYSETSVLLYSLEDVLKFGLCGNAADQFKSKYADVKTNLAHGEFIITIETQGTFSAARKIINIAAKCLSATTKIAGFYKKNMLQLNTKFSMEQLQYALHEVAAAMKKLEITIVGPMNLTKDHEKVLNDTWSTYYSGLELPKAKGTAANNNDSNSKHTCTIKTSNGFDSYMIKAYLQTNALQVMNCDDGLLLAKPLEAKYKNTDKIKKFVEQKYMKYADKLYEVLLICCALDSNVSASELAKIPKKPDQSKLVDSIKKHV